MDGASTFIGGDRRGARVIQQMAAEKRLAAPGRAENEENGSNFDAGRFLKSADGSIAGNIRLFQTILKGYEFELFVLLDEYA